MRGYPMALVASLFSGAALAGTCSVSVSGPVALVELYTSQGCSSCPPADRWLTGLDAARLPLQVVPLALHVPYWDYIGWRDPFASKTFEQRQRAAASQGRSRTVYTPQVMLNGRDLRGWHAGALERELTRLAARPARAKIGLSAKTEAGAVEVRLTGEAPAGTSVVLVRYENGLTTDVPAGENRGVRLRNDHVVRDWVDLGSVAPDGRIAFTRQLPARPDVTPATSGIAAFVQDAGGDVLQTAMLPYCP